MTFSFKCKLCGVCIENEIDFIAECIQYSELKEDLYKCIMKPWVWAVRGWGCGQTLTLLGVWGD